MLVNLIVFKCKYFVAMRQFSENYGNYLLSKAVFLTIVNVF